tara:strand:- start:550 stop:657 length:108 start_codon:yes stop_codon:yes gene_type:complete
MGTSLFAYLTIGRLDLLGELESEPFRIMVAENLSN